MSLNNFKSVDFDPFAFGELIYTAPTTEPQREIWLASLMGDEANRAFNESIVLHLQGALDRGALETAVSNLIQRHDALRTTISADGELLCINKEPSNPIIYTDISDLTQEDKDTRIAQYAKDAVTTSFDIIHGPLLHLHVLKLSPTQYQIIFTLHHIITDGWSLAVLLNDLGQLYKAAATNIDAQLPAALQYSDYAYLLQKRQQKHELKRQEEYWIKQYANDIPSMDIPTDYPRPRLRTYGSGFVTHKLDNALIHDLRKLGARAGCTLFTTLLSAYGLFLHRLIGESDIAIGIPAAGQSVIGENNLVGHCVNMLPLRCHIDSTQSFNDLLKQMRPHVLDAYEHQEFTFGSLLDKLPISRDPGRIPLIPVTFNIDQELRNLDFGAVQGFYITNPRVSDAFEMGINCVDSQRGFIVECDYNQALFDEETIQRRLAEFETLIKNIIVNPTAEMATLTMLPANEHDLILNQWSQTENLPQPFIEVHRRFELHAKATPNAVAVMHKEQSLTYEELNARANQLAYYLKEQDIKPDTIVGIYLSRSIEMIVAVLGILKAGGAYLPLDPAYPDERLQFMVDDAQPVIVLTQKDIEFDVPSDTKPQIVSLSDWSMFSDYSQENLHFETHPNYLAYVIYTSGSTGKPKGVQIEHGSMDNFVQSAIFSYDLGSEDRLLQFATIAFDVAVEEIFCTLVSGATLVLRTDTMLSSMKLFLETCAQWKITILDLPTAFWHELTISLHDDKLILPETLRLVLVGGEKANFHTMMQWLETVGSDVVFINAYGPTEATVAATLYDATKTELVKTVSNGVLIGRPYPNYLVYVLDANQQPVPIGVPGELFIGGATLARGYLNRPELTAEKFIPNPFGEGRLYRTGDLVRFLPDGNIEFMGRNDDQVKIRGFRIEPGEIEAVLVQHPSIIQAVVAVQEDKLGEKLLAAYIILDSEENDEDAKNIILSSIREFLKDKLPNYMMPTTFATLAEFPMTPNGKVNKRALPKPDPVQFGSDDSYVAPQTETEKAIAAIWADTLKVPKVSIYDDFFALGGHSLIAIQIVGRVRDKFDVDIALGSVFEFTTISTFAENIDVMQNNANNQPLVDKDEEDREVLTI